jgi:16S rRNA (guanine966-N2)-methyltransferase
MTKPNTMRITGGTLVRRRYLVPPLADEGLVRPTPDRVRESVFSMIQAHLPEAIVLDIFAGSGGHGFEAVSRGAASVVFVEKRPEVASIIKENIQTLGLLAQCQVKVVDAIKFIQSEASLKANVVFVDPPYDLQLTPEFFADLARFLAPEAIVIYRCFKKNSAPINEENWAVEKDKSYGGTRVFVLRHK